MFSKSLRVTPFLLVVICLSLAYFMTDARAQDPTTAGIVYSQPPNGALLPHQSSQLGYEQYGSDYDQYVWDNFMLSSTQAISQIGWRGVYNSGGYWGHGVIDFIVGIYPSIASNTQPDPNNPLVEYTLGGNAAETPAWTPGSVLMSQHDYTFVLPTPFTATAGTKYWVQIEAIQTGATDWGIVAGSGGVGGHFYAIPGMGGNFNFHLGSGDAAFTLLGPGQQAGQHRIYLPFIYK
jgi:hypothetical protein